MPKPRTIHSCRAESRCRSPRRTLWRGRGTLEGMALGSRTRRWVLVALMLGIIIPILLVLIAGAGLAYTATVGLGDTDPVPFRHAVGMVLSMSIVPFPGLAMGFRIWLTVAHRILRFSREDVESMISGIERPPVFGRLFQAWVDRAYGPPS